MLDILKDKEVIFFDVGYTLDYPASGDWMITNKVIEVVGDRCKKYSKEEILAASNKALVYLNNNHFVFKLEDEYKQFFQFYSDISDLLNLKLSESELQEIASDRTYNMKNYPLYSDTIETLEKFSKTHRLGIISDTWPSIETFLATNDLKKYFETFTYSCHLGTFKPDKRMYLDALEKMNVQADKAVFIDDSPTNVAGAEKVGITPILIAANPASDVDVPFTKIHSLKELW